MGQTFEISFTAQPDDIDIMGHVNNAVWVRWMEEIATAHWMSLARADDIARYVWVVTRHEIDYKGNVGLGETVVARTFIPDPPRGARFDRRVDFFGPDEKLKVSARTSWAMIDVASGRLARIPAEMAAPFLA
ncbi:MAG: acyl-CoA thioesterase [Sphingobium sp.]|nr:acyl-CoA thioesterase [Sphingobium sp.]